MKSTYVGTRSANVGDIRCSFAPASDSTNSHHVLPMQSVGMIRNSPTLAGDVNCLTF